MPDTSDCRETIQQCEALAANPALHFCHPPTRYEQGHALSVPITGVHPAVDGQATLVLEKFLGGGFAGQVYRARLTELSLSEGTAIPGLEVGRQYAIKIVIPPSGFSVWFRNTVYWLAFQGPFSSQVNHDACRAGLLLQKIIRRAAGLRFGREAAIKDAYASFHDPGLRAYGEITEWVEGRTWLLEADDAPWQRRHWRNTDLTETDSPEFIATRRFMTDMVQLLHDLGEPEFARQYEWWTMKSQPNVMYRTDVPADGPGSTLCAIDFRAGLALLPFLPMSPGDFKLIPAGLFRRGALVQFDRGDLDKLDRFVEEHAEHFADLAPAVTEFKQRDRAYRRSLPDLTHHGWRLPFDRQLRADVRKGLVEGYLAADLADEAFAERLRGGGLRFVLFYLLGVLPFLGTLLRRLWGNASYRRHLAGFLANREYRGLALRARAARSCIRWLRKGAVGQAHAEALAARPGLYLLERFTVGLLPGFLHRLLIEPSHLGRQIGDGWRFVREFWTSEEAREKWFLEMLDEGEKDGMLHPEERAAIAARVRDPFIVKYLKCLAVHFATLPITQVVSLLVGAIVAGWMLARGESWGQASLAFGGILALFQITPISPGSLCRGGYVVYLMIRERNWREYLIACPLSFVKYIGYLAFPLQMTTTYPALARFLAGRWATRAVHIIPVFGEKGALFEHWVFDAFFNFPRIFARWAKPRLSFLLAAWAALGIILTARIFQLFDVPLHGEDARYGVNLIIATVCVFVLPRALFYPLLTRKLNETTTEETEA
jgi:hypothetical protein